MRSNLPDPDLNQHSSPVRSFGSPRHDGGRGLTGFLALFLMTMALCFSSKSMAQGTLLQAGDVAIVGMNTATTDRFSLVLLRDIASGTVINVTDCGMASATTGRGNEGHVTYTAPGARTAGTIITWFNGMSISGTGWNTNNPTNFALRGSGDQLFVYQGSSTNWTSQNGITLIYGVNANETLLTSGSADSNTTYLPTALTLGTTFVNLAAAKFENTYFANQSTAATTVTVSGTKAQLLALFGNSANWFGNSGSASTFPAWTISVITGPSVSTTGTVSAMSTTYGTASAGRTFSVTASGLTNPVLVTPPAGFEVSRTSLTSGYADTQSLPHTSGSITEAPVYVRLKSTTPAGSYSGNITLSSGTASTTKAIASSTVSKKTVTVMGATAQDKEYNRNTAAVISGATVQGLVNSDVITVTGGGSFANFNVGNNKSVTAALTLSGTRADSYQLTQPTGLSASITPKNIALANIVIDNKIYDGTTTATISAGLNGVISPDEVLVNVSAAFASPFVGNGIAVNASADLFGADSANYTLTAPTNLSADITAKTLTIANAAAQSKVYDGNTNAQITGTLEGVIAPDEVTLVLQGTFASPEVGMDIAVTSTSYITGDIVNYTLVQPTGLKANISAEELLEQSIAFGPLTDVTYGDGTFTLSATASSTLAVSYSSSNTDVATVSGNTVTIRNAGQTTITATQSGDLTYEAAEPVAQVLTVLQKSLTLESAAAQDKVYDSNSNAVIEGTLSGIVSGDDVAFTGNGTFASANVAENIAVSSEISLSGEDVANYTMAQPSGLTADITPKTLTVVGAMASDKVYDATNIATIIGGELQGIVNSEEVTFTGSEGTFASVNVGENISVTASYTLTGTAASNYELAQPAGLVADITPLEVTITGLTASDKVYDATTNATVAGTAQVTGILGQDDVSVSGIGTATFGDKNVGNGKSVSIATVTLAGAQAANYTAVASADLTADITPASLTIANAQAVDKFFDGNTSAAITGTLTGVLASDNVTLVGTGVFASPAIGTDIAVTSTSTLNGTDAGNYVIDPQPAGLSADIIEGPTVLAPGDISIIGFQLNAPDTFVFVTWVDLYNDTVIKFTDNGFLSGASANAPNNARGGENYLIWKNDGAMIPAGTVIRIIDTNTNPVNFGTIVSGALNGLSASGDAIFAYQGPSTSGNNPDFASNASITTFNGTAIYGIYMQGSSGINSWVTSGGISSNSSYLPSELNVENASIAIANSASRGQFNGLRNNKTTFAAYKQLVNNAANWSTSSGSGTMTFNTTPFTLVTGPSAAAISGQSTVCVGENAQFSIAVTGGTSPYEVVYSDGSSEFTLSGYVSGNAVTVTPSATTTFTIVSVTDANGLTSAGNSGSAVITVNQKYAFYADEDFDGFGTGNSMMVCAVDALSPPVGFSVNNTDCNDELSSVNPGASEIPYNGIDDNCDGTIDENSRIYSQVSSGQCGTTLGSISSLIGAVSIGAPVNGYRFKVVNVATGAEQVIDRTVGHFQLTQLASYEYATTYEISVQVRRNGIWLNYYGPACQISTPAVLDEGGAVAVNPSQCGIVLPTISTLVATTSLPRVTGYRFRITDTETNTVQTIDRNHNWFSLTMLESYLYGRTYSVEVAIKTNGDYSQFGQPCTVSSPALPTLTNCGGSINTATTLIATRSLNRVTSYRFQLTDLVNFETFTIDRSANYFSFSNVPGFLPGAEYAVSVAVMTAGQWSGFSESCTITAPGASRSSVGKDDDADFAIDFKVVAYPNPYAESFAIDTDLPSQENVSVKVYDMVGRLVEQRNIASDALEVQQFGENYPSGVYNVIVSQGANVKTLRIVKR